MSTPPSDRYANCPREISFLPFEKIFFQSSSGEGAVACQNKTFQLVGFPHKYKKPNESSLLKKHDRSIHPSSLLPTRGNDPNPLSPLFRRIIYRNDAPLYVHQFSNRRNVEGREKRWPSHLLIQIESISFCTLIRSLTKNQRLGL